MIGGLRRWYNPPWFSESIPSTPYDPLALREAFEKVPFLNHWNSFASLSYLMLIVAVCYYPLANLFYFVLNFCMFNSTLAKLVMQLLFFSFFLGKIVLKLDYCVLVCFFAT